MKKFIVFLILKVLVIDWVLIIVYLILRIIIVFKKIVVKNRSVIFCLKLLIFIFIIILGMFIKMMLMLFLDMLILIFFKVFKMKDKLIFWRMLIKIDLILLFNIKVLFILIKVNVKKEMNLIGKFF